jgi:hypothetical protein
MTIRAKFTARPGARFVIRREAYRRITEALAAKGIRSAPKKFIVDLPGGIQLARKDNQDWKPEEAPERGDSSDIPQDPKP